LYLPGWRQSTEPVMADVISLGPAVIYACASES
jgi:hypothetical protein